MDKKGIEVKMEIINKFHTWLDIERAFKKSTNNFTIFKDGIVRISCFSDETEIFIKNASFEAQIAEWLKEIFSKKYDEITKCVLLEIGNQSYPISLLLSNEEEPLVSNYPLWSDIAYQNDMQIQKPLNNWNDETKIVVFDSFKGGVGRTTSLMTYVSACVKVSAENPLKILVIDADLEAPGISFWLEETNKPTVSFIRLLEGLHYPPVDTETTLKYFADELKKTSLTIDGNKEIYILPAALDVNEILDMPILPEHLARNPENPWALSDYLHTLGKYLDVSVVFIDLRAGLSELSSTLLFDPRIERFIVSTVTSQSIAGVRIILDRLSTFDLMESPTVVLSMLTDELRQLPDYMNAVEFITEAYRIKEEEQSGSYLTKTIDLIESDFEPNFMSINMVRKAIDILQKSSLFPTAITWAQNIINNHNDNDADVAECAEEEAAKLYDVCHQFQFAETGASDRMLVTEPLRNMAKHYSHTLPAIISIGSKGAGKTFNFIQICKQKSWQQFLTQIDSIVREKNDILIFPLLVSSNLEGESKRSVDECRNHCFSELGITNNFSTLELKEKIQANLKSEQLHWSTFWQREILFSFGLTGERLSELDKLIKEKNKQIIILVDGIEDLFDTPNDSSQADAIRALFDITGWIEELNSSSLGFVCFARQDYVRTVIKQNSSQFEARFAPFKLVWTPETFLRLTYWICGEAEIIGADSKNAAIYTMDKLLELLEKLWGKKLGKNASKEANSARWIFAALCDLKGQLQARDIVRFLKFASSQMKNSPSSIWKDRILSPEALRKAIPDCSKEKVEEAVKEIKALREWKEKIDNITDKRIPFIAHEMELSGENVSALSDLGIIYEDKELGSAERFYVPEIYRYGLGFNSTIGGARPRILALLKRNLGGMPF